jgi:hypothetical protein
LKSDYETEFSDVEPNLDDTFLLTALAAPINAGALKTSRRLKNVVGSLILATGISVLGAGPASRISQADVTAFRDHLVRNQLNVRWEGEPTAQLDSEEIRRAYGDRRFYFTFKAPPLPPGAAWPDLIERHKQAMAEYQKHSLRITVGIDNEQRAVTFQTAQDFNTGLMPVKSDDDARIAAAAILSLIGNDQVHPAVIGAREVSVTGTQFGWTCRVKQTKGIDGTVVFDPSGHCTSASKRLNYVPPVPP